MSPPAERSARGGKATRTGKAGRTGKPRKRSRRGAARPSFARRWGRRALVLLGLALAGAVALALLYRHHVVEHPGAHLARDHILAVISQETTVYYHDGETTLGVFFDSHHRQYVPYDEVPQAFVDALVATEDHRFWRHHGFDTRGFARAMLANLEARDIVEGGSTLTMQTAENLFFAQRAVTVPDKAHEMVDALRLEHHYTKEDILEFYLNQFYVNGNGRGLGIAARYFFDKDVTELSTLECAFLAGVVQSPSLYDPFLGDDEETRQRALDRAHARTHHVLDRMAEEGYLTAEERDALQLMEIPFRRGRFRYAYDVVLESVSRELDSEHFRAVLREAGIENPSTAGIEIVTTLDATIQREALYGLRHHLTDAGVPLEGADLGDVTFELDEPRPVAGSSLLPHTFHNGRIVAVDPDEGTIDVDLGGTIGTVDREGSTRLATLVERSRTRNRWAEASRRETAALLRELSVGDGVWVSIREREGDELSLDVEHRGELEGGLIVLEDGEIRAMVGGSRNRDFNRAVQARRQFGSTFKPLVYYAALQLGWTITDELDNRREVFPFEGSFYYPRPDHQGAPEQVSMAWAGVHSENVASVWLLYHLTDPLNEAQFAEVAERAGLTRRDGETREQYIERIRDREGVVATDDRIREGLFDRAREDARVDLLFDGREEQAEALQRLHYGIRFGTERARQDDAEKRAILRRSLLYLEERAADCRPDLQRLREAADGGKPLPRVGGLAVGTLDGERTVSCGDPGEGWTELDRETLARWAGEPGGLAPILTDDRVVVHGQLSLATLDEVRTDIDRRFADRDEDDLYALSTLQLLRDFRTLVAIRYVTALAREMGIRQELASGLSLPLGSSDISLLELALAYQCLRDGRVHYFDGVDEPGVRPTAVIAQIRLEDGTVIYEAERGARQLVPPSASEEITQVLRQVVERGTGERAAAALPEVPLGGKTGTTNAYRNAAFVGIVPRPVDGVWSMGEGLVIASYVGFDDNRKMARGSIRLAGATGSLPAWLGAARGVRLTYGAGLPDPSAVARGEGLEAVEVDERTGLPGSDVEGGVTLYRTERSEGWYRPFEPWRAR